MGKVLKPGLLWLSGAALAPTATYYPDPLDQDSTPTTNTKGLSDSSTLGVFSASGRDAVIHGVWMKLGAGTEILNLKTLGGSPVTVMTFELSSTSSQFYSFGPEGLRVPGGFSVEVAGSGSSTFSITYEVV
jgi:hypothetical protein